jgi:hypothetical protein
MEDIYVKESPTTPEVRFSVATGNLEIKGVSIPEDTEEFYKPLTEWIEEYIRTQKPERVIMAFKLIYVNTSTSAVLGKIIKLLEPPENKKLSIKIQWYYEAEDEDMKDLGEDFHSFTKLPFELVPCQEIS